MHRSYCQTLTLTHHHDAYHAEFCLCVSSLADLMAQAPQFLHAKEYDYLLTLKHDRRRLSYLLGRYTGKQAISHYLQKNLQKEIPLPEILIDYGKFQYPLIYLPVSEKIQITYSHTGHVCMAIVYDEAAPMAIDLEQVEEDRNKVIKTQLTSEEITLLDSLYSLSEGERYTMLWTAKEALSKVLRTGLTTPFKIYAIKNINTRGEDWIAEFKNFSQYHALSFALKDLLCSIVFPKQLQLNINTNEIKEWLNTCAL